MVHIVATTDGNTARAKRSQSQVKLKQQRQFVQQNKYEDSVCRCRVRYNEPSLTMLLYARYSIPCIDDDDDATTGDRSRRRWERRKKKTILIKKDVLCLKHWNTGFFPFTCDAYTHDRSFSIRANAHLHAEEAQRKSEYWKEREKAWNHTGIRCRKYSQIILM